MSIAKLLISRRRGDSPLEGVGFETQTATYFWDPVSAHSLTHNLRVIAKLCHEILSVATKYGIDCLDVPVYHVKNCIWRSFADTVL